MKKQLSVQAVKVKCVSVLIELCREVQKINTNTLKFLEIMSFFSPVSATSQVRPDIKDLEIILKKS